jgi:Domain of unknown function (DUF1906)
MVLFAVAHLVWSPLPVYAGPAGATVIEKHRGFDACDNVSVATMAAAWSATSYSTVGFYIGGQLINAVCPSHAGFHNAAWVDGVYAITSNCSGGVGVCRGWNFQPIWDGIQMPCSGASFPHSTNETTAYQQGLSEASAAVSAAQSRGFAAGSIVYMDLEAAATRSYVNGWNLQLHAFGYWSGVYSGPCVFSSGSSTTGLVPVAPDSISIADYNGSVSNPKGVYQLSASSTS